MKNKPVSVISALMITASLAITSSCSKGKEAARLITTHESNIALKDPVSFFPRMDLMKIGVYYYPEQWPESQWERDINNIARYGFEFTHFAEFSWAELEPSDGEFDFSWLDRAVDLAAKAGLKVIMCTPTPCPPNWLNDKHPEIYLTGGEGRRREPGIRSTVSLTDPVYLQYSDRIAEKMAEHYGHDSRIWGWQLDNEPQGVPDYSNSSLNAFRAWLRDKYQTIDDLNKSWGGSFWSTKFDSFEQVIIPNETLNFEDKLSPHAVLDFRRFTADMQGQFLNRQYEILRKNIGSSQWITTNYTNVTYLPDPRRSDKLDFLSFTMYPVNGTNILGGNNFRTGNPYRIYEACDYYRSFSGVTGLMELQPGQVNWASVNPQPLPGTVHMWIMQAFGGGCSFLCTYRYRHPLWSSEMYHEGIVGTDGVTLSSGGKQFVQSIGEIKRMREAWDSTAVRPSEMEAIKTALLWSHDCMWDLDIQPQTPAWSTWRNRNNYSAAVKSTGAPMDFITENDDFNQYKFIIVPSYQLVDSALINKWQDFVINGGNLILSCRTGFKDKNGHFFESEWAGPMRKLTGTRIEFFDMLPTGIRGSLEADKHNLSWDVWSEILIPDEGTKVLARYTDQYYKGKPAAVRRKLGKGTVTYIGAASSDGTVERQLVRDAYSDAGLKTEDLPAGVYHEWRDGFNVLVNYSDNNYSITLPSDSRIFTGSLPVVPGSALVWK